MSREKILGNLTVLALCSLGGAALAFITQVVLARNLGVYEYGLFSSTFAVVALMTPLAGFGIAPMWLKVFGLEGVSAKRWIKSSFVFSALSTVMVILSILIWAHFAKNNALEKLLLSVMSLYILGQVFSELVSGKLQLEERYYSLALWQFLPHFWRFFIIISIVYFSLAGNYLFYAACSYAVVSLVVSAYGFFQLKSMSSYGVSLKKTQDYYSAVSSHSSVTVGEVLKCSWPFGMGAFAHLVYYQSDIVMVKYFVGGAAAGEYNVAFVIMSAVYLLPTMLYQKYLMPKIHRWANYDHHKFYNLYNKGIIGMLTLGCIATALVWLLGGFGISLLFGTAYLGAESLLNILAVSAPIIFLALNSGAVLVTQENMIKKVKYMIFVAILNVLLNMWFIPIWGAHGAAVSTVLSNIVLLALYQYGASKKISLLNI